MMTAADGGIVLVTGSNGSIGSAVMRRFAGKYPQVVGFDRKAPTPPQPGCVYLPVDITSVDSVREGLRVLREHHGTTILSVIHLAAYYDFFGAPSPLYEQITVQGTGRLLRGLHDMGFTVEQFVFSSTMLVHAPGEPGQFMTEDWPIHATWAYPESKVKTEAIIHAGRGEIPAVVLRISGIYDDGCHSIPLAHQIQRIYERQFTNRFYSASTAHGQSFMHLDDLVDALERVVNRRTTLPAELTLLVGEPDPLSYDELQHTFARLIHGKSFETIIVPRLVAKPGAWAMNLIPGSAQFIKPWMIDRAGDHYALDLTRLRATLDWQPTRTLRATMPLMVAALTADPLLWYKENKLEPSSRVKKLAAPNVRVPVRSAP